jgi:hypothetical protein
MLSPPQIVKARRLPPGAEYSYNYRQMTGAELLDLIGKYCGVFATTLLGSWSGAYFGSYLRKKGENLATHEDVDKLVEQVSAVTAATKQIEARITRASRVHERQLDILGKLYRHLYDAQELFRRETSAGMTNGMAPEEYAPRLVKAMGAAQEEFLNGRLFIPLDLVQLCEGFFDAVSKGQRDFEWSLHSMIDPIRQTEFWKAAAAVAHEQVPKILEQIDDAGRAVVRGEATRLA